MNHGFILDGTFCFLADAIILKELENFFLGELLKKCSAHGDVMRDFQRGKIEMILLSVLYES